MSVSRTQAASEPVRGYYSLVLEGQSTTPLSFHATPLEASTHELYTFVNVSFVFARQPNETGTGKNIKED